MAWHLKSDIFQQKTAIFTRKTVEGVICITLLRAGRFMFYYVVLCVKMLDAYLMCLTIYLMMMPFNEVLCIFK